MRSKLVLGSAFGLAAIAAAIDHTKHSLPEPVEAQQNMIIIEDGDSESGSPCGLGGESPCSLGG